jgi:O-antigen/teichoic acid export membrane protein
VSVLKKLVGQTAIYGLSSIVGRLLNFLLVPLYTSIFALSEYGVLSVLMTLVAFAMVVLTYGLETSFFHFANKESNAKNVFSTAFLSLLGTTLLFLCIVLPQINQISGFLHIVDKPELILYLVWVLAFDVLSTLPFAKLRLDNRAWRFASIRLINIVANIGLNLFFFLLCPYLIKHGYAGDFINSIYDPNAGIAYIFIAYLVSSFLTLVLLLPEIFSIRLSFDFTLWKRMISYSFPLLVGGLAYVTNEMVDRILLEYLLPKDIASAQIGIYSACYKIAIFMSLFIQAFRYAAEPFFFAQAKLEGAKEQYAHVMRYSVAFTGLIFLGVNVYIDILKGFIRNEAFHEGLAIVPILLLANLFLGIYFNLSVWYKVSDNTRFGAYIALFGALVTITLNLLLIPTMSYMGSAWATLFCYGSMCIVSYALSRKYYPIPYDFKRIFSYLFLALLLFYIWTIWHDDYFVFSSILCFAYMFAVWGLENGKKEVISSTK